jgi:nitrogenase molybdenum-iron protein beta chain
MNGGKNMTTTPLLRHTDAKILPREALTINPSKTCQPIGALYAALGVHGCLPHSHGSQGCCAYHRSALTRHYKEPVMAATSSFTEGASVFGGQSNLLQAISTIFSLYDPEIIAVHTTCLSETIGDDIPQIIGKAEAEGKIPAGRFVMHASTPSYVGSHVTGFSSMTRAFVDYFADGTGIRSETLAIFPGWVEPSDMAELKRVFVSMRVPFIMLPDTSGVLDAPLTGRYEMYPEGGTRLADIRRMGDCAASIALGPFASGAGAKLLDTKCRVPTTIMDLPIGLSATDRFLDTLRRVAGVAVPESIVRERGRLVDMMADMHQYTYGKTVALAGDPDQLCSLAEFLSDLDMKVKYIVTGTPGKPFESRLGELIGPAAAGDYRGAPGDLFGLHQRLKAERTDLLFANTYGKYIARDEDIPFIRFGFPILDRVGHADFPTVGYLGGVRLLEKILSALMDRIDRDAPGEKFELIL